MTDVTERKTEFAKAPAINLPKGGGAIRGIDEKFATNPVTGTGSMTVPIATSPGRSGFGQQLLLAYDSGAGNGPFGFGWNLSIPSISRKTDKGIPQYHDAEHSDVFILSGAEDLVPVLNPDGSCFEDNTTVAGYTIHRYRPRIEGLFAHIERRTHAADPKDVHWRSISKDNVLTIYGKDADSRIADPADPGRIFSWLICETRDDKGNAVLYDYKPEDGTGVDLIQAHERNRGGRDDPGRKANCYIKRIYYGNRVPLLDSAGHRPRFLTAAQIQNAKWMFEVVFDYGEHDADVPKPVETGPWTCRDDPFSSYRAGFEVRTYRLCRRVLMFHHFPGEAEVGKDCLVRSTDFTYSYEQDPANARNPVYTFLNAVTQNGYRRRDGGYVKRSMPPVEFEYTQPIVQDRVHEIDAASLENLPIGLDGIVYQWTDLHGEGVPGILTEQGGGWFYKRNLSPISKGAVELAPVESVTTKPNLELAGGQAQFMDLAGDGQPDLVVLDSPMPGLYEHDGKEGWQPFRPFTSQLTRDMSDPNLKLIDLNGDGHADVLISEDHAFVWHASLAEQGFGPARRVCQALDEDKGPRLVFADGTQAIYLADLSGDGLTDLARIRNGEVCYWPNLGYGRFGAKVAMDHAPHFDHPEQFDQKRIRLADIDGTGTTDIIYLHGDGVRLYFNQSGNRWSAPQSLSVFPRVDDLTTITPADLLGNGSACLVWSSSLPSDAGRQMRYVDLMGGKKPHLLVKVVNNLGAETNVQYAPSTKFYLQDKRDGKPWLTRLPFPVHVVEHIETLDRISGNRFVTRYAYHHGYFDGVEREFRGFGMVEQWDTEEFAALTNAGALPAATNLDAASHVPPVLTKTWFHTGVYLGRDHVSDFFAGLLNHNDIGEYYREPDLSDTQARALLLKDTILPAGLTLEEEREACRALKGSMLRQEVYALDGTDKAEIPYTVTEQNFTIKKLQPAGKNPHAVFFTHTREAISYHYERDPDDPRLSHALTLEVDDYGNVLKEIAIGYGRRSGKSPLEEKDKKKQEQTLITYTENSYTNAIDDSTNYPNDYRTPLPAEVCTYELTGFEPEKEAARFSFEKWSSKGFASIASATEIDYEDMADITSEQKRLIEHIRILYREDDLSALLPLKTLEPRALPGESYQLAFTPGLAKQVYVDSKKLTATELNDILADKGNYVHSEGDANWWIPSGQVFYSPKQNDTAGQERGYAAQHFFQPLRFRDPFGQTTTVSYDAYDLLAQETRDAIDNRTTSGERDSTGKLVKSGNDYRVLQPTLVMDPNRNRSAVVFDALGMVVGTAVMGKPEENLGDSLDGFSPDLSEATVSAHLQNPLTNPQAILQHATMRLVYDLFAYQRTQAQSQPQPAVVYTLARETHDADLKAGQQTKVQHSFSYSDGFGREIQQKIQAESEKINGTEGSPRWVGSGWTIFNNKGKPVRQYEPFFSATHHFEFAKTVGVSPVLFYDPLERVVATLHPNHSYEKVVFNPWRQMTYDVNDTVLIKDPKDDLHVSDFFARLPESDYLPTWYAQREGEAMGAQEKEAALKAAVHANTPTVTHFDALGRPFLTVAHNRFERNAILIEEKYPTRVVLDIEGNECEVQDEWTNSQGDREQRIVMRYDYSMAGPAEEEDEEDTSVANLIHQASMEAGERWVLNDVAGNSLCVWDSRGHAFRNEYDVLRRATHQYLQYDDGKKVLLSRIVYGEHHADSDGGAGEHHLNLRGQIYLHFDQAGVVINERFDFKGNLLAHTRRLARNYKPAKVENA
jgi:YD repeat-containing protein